MSGGKLKLLDGWYKILAEVGGGKEMLFLLFSTVHMRGDKAGLV